LSIFGQPPRQKQSRGDCAFCGREMTKSGLTKHLKSGPPRQKAIENAETAKKKTGKKQLLYEPIRPYSKMQNNE